MSKKAIVAIGLALALTLAMTGSAAAVGTQNECQSVGTLDGGEFTDDDTDTTLSGDDVSVSCCTTECGIF